MGISLPSRPAFPAPLETPPICSEPQLVFADFETFWSQDYSVRKLDPPSYILDPRFEAICLGVAFGNADPVLIDGPDIADWLAGLPADVTMVSHNALFDMCILSWRYGYVPRVIVDTLSIARTLLGHKYRHLDLGTLAAHYGLQKGDLLTRVKGMTRADIIANGLWSELAAYCLQDVAICRHIALDLIPHLPPEELALHDVIARCAVEPALRLDSDLLAQHHGDVIKEKDMKFVRAMLAGLRDKDQLMSNPQFAELLRDMGVEPPVKRSPTTGSQTFAFSKKDPEFLALLDHDDPRVQAVVEARMAFKSTLEETRTHRMLNIGSLEFPYHGGTGLMPIPLIVGAAHTHRLGGGWKLNAQNWGRNSPIRKAIIAPDGYKIVAADSAQIEARMNAWFCGQDDLLEEFRRGEDVYANFASDIYGERVTKETNPRARRIGKTGVLQLGYQSGALKFKDTLWVDTYNDPDGAIEISEDEAQRVVTSYRTRMNRISGMWRRLQTFMLPILAGEKTYIPELGQTVTALEYGPLIFEKGRIVGPTGLCLYYENLRMENGQWFFHYAHSTHEKLYGGKLLENIIQFLARLAVMSAAVRLKKLLDVYTSRLTHSAHDEIVYIVPDEHVGVVRGMIHSEMTKPPGWAPTLPLACEVGVGVNYGDAK